MAIEFIKQYHCHAQPIYLPGDLEQFPPLKEALLIRKGIAKPYQKPEGQELAFVEYFNDDDDNNDAVLDLANEHDYYNEFGTLDRLHKAALEKLNPQPEESLEDCE